MCINKRILAVRGIIYLAILLYFAKKKKNNPSWNLACRMPQTTITTAVSWPPSSHMFNNLFIDLSIIQPSMRSPDLLLAYRFLIEQTEFKRAGSYVSFTSRPPSSLAFQRHEVFDTRDHFYDTVYLMI